MIHTLPRVPHIPGLSAQAVLKLTAEARFDELQTIALAQIQKTGGPLYLETTACGRLLIGSPDARRENNHVILGDSDDVGEHLGWEDEIKLAIQKRSHAGEPLPYAQIPLGGSLLLLPMGGRMPVCVAGPRLRISEIYHRLKGELARMAHCLIDAAEDAAHNYPGTTLEQRFRWITQADRELKTRDADHTEPGSDRARLKPLTLNTIHSHATTTTSPRGQPERQETRGRSNGSHHLPSQTGREEKNLSRGHRKEKESQRLLPRNTTRRISAAAPQSKTGPAAKTIPVRAHIRGTAKRRPSRQTTTPRTKADQLSFLLKWLEEPAS